MIISLCAPEQRNQDSSNNYIVMSNDVKRAYFYAPASRPVYSKIPDEDWEEGDESMVGH